MIGAFHGGFEGALKGAAIGFVLGATIGTGIDKFGPGFAIGAAIVGATYAGVTGGAEGLVDFAAGAAGSVSGYYAGQAIVSGSTNLNAPLTQKSGTQTPKANEPVKNAVKTGDFEKVKQVVEQGTGKPSGTSGNDTGNALAEGGQSGKAGQGKNPDIDSINQKDTTNNFVRRALEVHKEIHQKVYNLGKGIGGNKLGHAYGVMAGMEMMALGGIFIKAGGAAISAGGPGGWVGGTFVMGLGAEITWLGVDFLRGVGAGAATVP